MSGGEETRWDADGKRNGASAPDVKAKLSQAQAAEQAAQALNEKAQRGTRQEQLQAAYEIWQKAKAGVEIAEKSYNRVNRLFEEGVMSAQKRDEAKAQFDAMSATEKAARSQYEMAKNGAQREDKAAAAAPVERRISCYAKRGRTVTNSPRRKNFQWFGTEVGQDRRKNSQKTNVGITLFGRKNWSSC